MVNLEKRVAAILLEATNAGVAPVRSVDCVRSLGFEKENNMTKPSGAMTNPPWGPKHQASKAGTLYCLHEGRWLQCTLGMGQAALPMLHQGMGLAGCR